MDSCCICNKTCEDENFAILRQKGVDGIRAANPSIVCNPGDRVHKKCRLDVIRTQYVKKKSSVEDTVEQPRVISRRSKTSSFNSKENCIFCGQGAKFDGKKRGFDTIPVRTIDFQNSIAKVCKERNDEWSDLVLGRLEYAQDLHAADTVYHQACSVNFRTGKSIPVQYSGEYESNTKTSKPGRPVDNLKSSAFMKVVDYLEENDDEQTTVADLVCKMGEFLEGTGEEPYSSVYMKSKLQDYFKHKIIITTLQGVDNVVTFKQTVESVINEFYSKPRQENSDEERKRIIKTAAELIKNDVKSIDASYDVYPSSADMSDIQTALDFVPKILQSFLRTLFVGKDVDLKIASLGQAIIQAVRPRVLMVPLQIGLGVQMHHHFSSKFLIDSLNSHGFCASYKTVTNYEKSAAVAQGTEIPGYTPERFVQYAADNVDHNTRTLDGSGTFHGMGIIATITPGTESKISIPKRKVTAEDIAKTGRIEIRPFTGPAENTPLHFKELKDLQLKDPTANLDLLWKLSQPLLKSPRPAWSGMMQVTCNGPYPGKSSVFFLPMIDMDASDMTCIYSTLHFIAEQAERYNYTPIVTFDQPLWWKAQMITSNEAPGSKLKSIVLRLGGLHVEMSFSGCIGHIMAGSGIEDVLELVYAKNTVPHILSGKAVARAIRGHLLVDAALNALLVSDAFDLPLHVENMPDQLNADLESAKELYERLIDNPDIRDEVYSSEVLARIGNKLTEKKESLLNGSRTAALWLEYMKMVDILRLFIKAERTGNWLLHLQATYEMLPYFAAAGHNLYTKSAYIYCQQMQDLENTHPDVYKRFTDGFHVARRSGRFWGGLSTDLMIEQVLMRSVKTTGGLTRGKGISEIQRLVWLMSMPICADVNNSMQSLTGVNYVTSEQHKDTTKARKERDHKDTNTIIAYLAERNPFSIESSLRNIATGVVAENSVNCDKSREVGEKIVEALKGKDANEHTFRKKDQVVTLASKTSVKLKDDEVQIDPQLMFQRLSIVATAGRYENPARFFEYEMSSYPTSLFDNSLLPRKANKPVLAEAIWSMVNDSQAGANVAGESAYYVLDGGALLHRVPWPRGVSYETICSLYVQYIERRYPRATIVFDGYDDEPSTKDCTHQRRHECGPAVLFDSTMIITLKKEIFLSNKTNKQKFINLLAATLERKGYSTVHATGDADVLIVNTAISKARSFPTVLVGDDTDLLVLLLHYGELEARDLFFRPEPRQQGTRRAWDIKKAKISLGPDVCSKILFAHAILGCDTTSRVHGIGKGLALKKLQSSSQFRELAGVFNGNNVLKDDVIAAGEKALLHLYNATSTESLDALRYNRYCQRVASGKASLQPENLPPTCSAAKFHSQRVYLQVQEWSGNTLNPQNWGWKLSGGKFLPVLTDRPPAHELMLAVIRCNCKTDCKTKRCVCKKNGLECSSACGVCKGESCLNSSAPDFDEECLDDSEMD